MWRKLLKSPEREQMLLCIAAIQPSLEVWIRVTFSVLLPTQFLKNLLCWQETFWFFCLEKGKVEARVSRAELGELLTFIWLKSIDWKASENGQMVTWYGSEVGCLMVYGFWPNIHSFWDVFFMLFQAVKCLEYKALPFRGSAWVMACWEATRGHTGHHRTFYSFLEKRFFSFLK